LLEWSLRFGTNIHTHAKWVLRNRDGVGTNMYLDSVA